MFVCVCECQRLMVVVVPRLDAVERRCMSGRYIRYPYFTLPTTEVRGTYRYRTRITDYGLLVHIFRFSALQYYRRKFSTHEEIRSFVQYFVFPLHVTRFIFRSARDMRACAGQMIHQINQVVPRSCFRFGNFSCH